MCARAACQYFRKAGKEGNLPNGGAIVNTSSTSGLLGNPGQANYGAAKMGIVGMMNTMAQELGKYNVRINTIAPMALTRLTEDLPIAGMMKQLTPAHIAPVVIFLCSDAAEGINGQIFGTFGKYVQIWRLPRPVHYYEAEGDIWDPNDLAKNADHMRKVIEAVNAPYMPGSPGPKFEE
jgi:NAD(P)-dependent dehydrogenase (short-subunit alcohol dehydrogenase family)